MAFLRESWPDLDSNPLPDPVTDGLSAIADQIWQQLAEAADARIEDAEKIANARVATATDVREKVLQQCVDMERTLESVQALLTESEARGQSLQTALKEAEKKTQVDAIHTTQLMGNIEKLTLQLANQQSECERMERYASKNEEGLTAVHNQLAEQNKLLASEKKAHTHTRETFTAEKDQLAHQQATLRKELNTLRTALDDVKDKLTASNQEHVALRHQVDTLSREKTRLEKDIANAEAVNVSFEKMTTLANTAVNELIAEKDARIAELMSIFAKLIVSVSTELKVK